MANLKQKTTFQDYGLPSNGREYSKTLAQRDIEYLYEKLNKFSRKETQWDFYKIVEVIKNKEDFQAQINNLPPYTSAIINSKFEGDDNSSYNKGDLVFKHLDGSTEHIKAERGGVFYPQTIKNLSGSNNFDIHFQYLSHEPKSGNIQAKSTNNGLEISSKDVRQTLKFEGLPIQAPTDLYGDLEERPSTTTTNSTWNTSFSVKSEDSTPVQPIIKMYNDIGEEVYCECKAAPDNATYPTQWKVNNIPYIVKLVVVK